MSGGSQSRLREAVRALILDPDDQVLLVHFNWDGLDLPGGFWANPGGGVEPGESRLDTLRRELREEIGLHIESLGTEVWTKTAYFEMNGWDGQVDHVHLVRTPRFEPAPEMTPDELAAENVHDVRWWALDELSAKGATFAPRALPKLMHRLLAEGVPRVPIEFEGL